MSCPSMSKHFMQQEIEVFKSVTVFLLFDNLISREVVYLSASNSRIIFFFINAVFNRYETKYIVEYCHCVLQIFLGPDLRRNFLKLQV